MRVTQCLQPDWGYFEWTEQNLRSVLKCLIIFSVKAVLSSGSSASSSSYVFYVDNTPPIFDLNEMTPMYVDIVQGEFTPVRFQSSNSTIKAFWRCYDEESVIVVRKKIWKLHIKFVCWFFIDKKSLNSKVNNVTNINKTNNYHSPLIEHKSLTNCIT
jgi:hypothetical protein